MEELLGEMASIFAFSYLETKFALNKPKNLKCEVAVGNREQNNIRYRKAKPSCFIVSYITYIPMDEGRRSLFHAPLACKSVKETWRPPGVTPNSRFISDAPNQLLAASRDFVDKQWKI